MKSSDSIKELAAALAAAQAEMGGVGKSGKNDYDRYKYAKLEDYVNAAHAVMHKHGLSFVSGAEEIIPLDDRTTQKGGTEHAVRVKVVGRIIHASGEWVETSAWGEGQDRADKAVYKAITGARKYLLASAFDLATTDDPEADEHVGRSGPPQQRPQARPAPAAQESPGQRRVVAENGRVIDADTGEEIQDNNDLLTRKSLANELNDLIDAAEKAGKINPNVTVRKWLAAAGVARLEEMTLAKLNKCITYMRALPAPKNGNGQPAVVGGVPAAATSAA